MNNLISKPLALVPARSGSQRIKRKNMVLLGGKPLLAWTLAAALEASIFDAVWVSSEDEITLQAAEAWGGKALWRQPSLAGEQVTVAELSLHVIHQLSAQDNGYTALYVLLPTSPFRQPATIRLAWQSFLDSSAEALLSVAPLEYPPQWSMTRLNEWLAPLNPDAYRLPRQRLATAYRHDGGHAIASIPFFLRNRDFMSERTLAFPVPPVEAVDINEPLDLAWAEFLLHQGLVQSHE